MTPTEVSDMLEREIPEGSSVLEIGCGRESTITLEEMWKKGLIGAYLGFSVKKNCVDETQARGLIARLVKPDQDYLFFFKRHENNYGEKAVVVISEVAPEEAKKYAKQARDLGIKRVVSYLEI